ncbi:molybdopterin-guanine dinucleotide biosynthesis protein B [Jeotgalibacillus haloalkalitolerans]|uniref:Molybdopterin-guanine dinucleotide biosynthesis protein B n=1 Tax=Jeotgalibacillus haloalkalitolerans TaxID=3104292 RepID=A0ABU5KQ47_9BACL|nr:molybdopterin-guanine dinucleotide biosynthesis protein B [Jeotgalibacillus sp. HH7-29]MDZ5713305.1 molybdopterin-guanine dinucleotide biosynthesis protein B [Jeotgalibacillus sp. HH7-29]
MPILQVVGYQNSGKTTVMNRLVRTAAENGLKAGTIKHHGHGGVPDYTNTAKDSSRHFQAGAAISTVEGSGAIVIESVSGLTDLENLLTFYRTLPLHVILVEGYKREPFSKIVVIRNEEELALLDQCLNIKAVISAVQIDRPDLTVFEYQDVTSYTDWFGNWLKEAGSHV